MYFLYDVHTHMNTHIQRERGRGGERERESTDELIECIIPALQTAKGIKQISLLQHEAEPLYSFINLGKSLKREKSCNWNGEEKLQL